MRHRHFARRVDGEREFAEGWSASKSKGEAQKRAAMAAPTHPVHRSGVLGLHPDFSGPPPRSNACAAQGRACLSPSLPLHPCLRQQRGGVRRRLRHLTDVLFPASPSFFQAAPRFPHPHAPTSHTTARGEQRRALTSIVKVKLSARVTRMGNSVL